jgi:predicted dehydrogenase
MNERFALALVGCGGMGLRHVHGLAEMRRYASDSLALVAVCDVHESSAHHVAQLAERELGRLPRVYTDYETMLERERSLEAVDIATDPLAHHQPALAAFDAGLHVAVEKPMAVSVRAGRRMIEAAADADRLLSIFENYRRDPINRLVKAVLDAGAIGAVRLMLTVTTDGGARAQQIAAWRHLKLYGGCVLEFTVHKADLIRYFCGPVASVYAETAIFEKVRLNSDEAGRYTEFYDHRVRPDIERGTAFEPTAEDTALAVIRFESGGLAQLSMSVASPGERWHRDVIYGSEGSLVLPRSRSGRRPEITLDGGRSVAPLDCVPDFALDDDTAVLFNGRRRIDAYDLSFREIDAKLLAIEFAELVDGMANGRQPEVDGATGLQSVALCHAILESGHAGQPVSFAAVWADAVNAYQEEINDAVGLGSV